MGDNRAITKTISIRVRPIHQVLSNKKYHLV